MSGIMDKKIIVTKNQLKRLVEKSRVQKADNSILNSIIKQRLTMNTAIDRLVSGKEKESESDFIWQIQQTSKNITELANKLK